MRIFHKKDGGVIQLIEKKKIMEWPIELPLIFVEFIRNSKLDTYGDPKVKKEIEQYLEEITKDVAIPRFIDVLEGENYEEIILALTRIEELSKKKSKIDMIKPIEKYLDNLFTSNNKEISRLANNISKSFASAERKKKLEKKRKIMKEKEEKFLAGNISAEDYAKARKEYLVLKD
ncbi:MAG: hypothetical protein KGD63_10255 [Candidatus Lokiarchaeota archaeon]|nr:hypothetical protein [Candidatus Lokiarchaeota archaeon]